MGAIESVDVGEQTKRFAQDISNAASNAALCLTTQDKCVRCMECTIIAGTAFKVAYMAVIEKKSVKDMLKSLLIGVFGGLLGELAK